MYLALGAINIVSNEPILVSLRELLVLRVGRWLSALKAG